MIASPFEWYLREKKGYHCQFSPVKVLSRIMPSAQILYRFSVMTRPVDKVWCFPVRHTILEHGESEWRYFSIRGCTKCMNHLLRMNANVLPKTITSPNVNYPVKYYYYFTVMHTIKKFSLFLFFFRI